LNTVCLSVIDDPLVHLSEKRVGAPTINLTNMSKGQQAMLVAMMYPERRMVRGLCSTNSTASWRTGVASRFPAPT
jgi:hypothetical protein